MACFEVSSQMDMEAADVQGTIRGAKRSAEGEKKNKEKGELSRKKSRGLSGPNQVPLSHGVRGL